MCTGGTGSRCGWILQDLMWAMVRSSSPADPVDALARLFGRFAQFAVGDSLWGRDHSPVDASLVGDPPGGAQPRGILHDDGPFLMDLLTLFTDHHTSWEQDIIISFPGNATRHPLNNLHRPGSTADTMKNPASPHHHNGKPELEQHIHAYNPLLNQGRPVLLPEGRSETDSTSGSHRCLTGRRRS